MATMVVCDYLSFDGVHGVADDLQSGHGERY
jgi:hypothetical protein